MADHYGDKFFPPSYFPAGYFQGGEQNPGAMSASLSGSASVLATLSVAETSAATLGGGGRKRRDERDEYQSYSEYFDELNKLRRSIKERKAPSQQRKLVAKVASARQRLVEQDEIDLGPLRASVASLAKSVTVLERARAEAAAMAELDRLAAQAALFEEIAVVLLMAA